MTRPALAILALVAAVGCARPKDFTIAVDVAGGGEVVSSPPGISCASSSCRARFPVGTRVALAETAGHGAAFFGFSGDCAGDACALVVGRDLSVGVRFDAARPIVYATKIGEDGADRARAVLALADGGAIVAGASDGTGWLARAGGDGALRWKEELDAAALAPGPDGTCYAAGAALVRVTEDGTTAWTRPLAAPAIDLATTPAGDVFVLTAAGGLVSFGADGARRFAAGVGAGARALAVGDGGELYVARDRSVAIVEADGRVRDGRDYPGPIGDLAAAGAELVVAGTESTGLFADWDGRWRQTPACDRCRVRSLALDGDDVIVSGAFHGALGGLAARDDDTFVAAWDGKEGEPRWSLRLPAAGDDAGAMISVGKDRRIVVSGTFAGVLDVDAQRLVAEGPSDVYVIALAP